jgi:hypothetical protein
VSKLVSSKGTVMVNGQPKFPTNTPGRARAALARINQGKGLTVGQKRKVIAAAYKRLGVPSAQRRIAVSSKGAIVHKPWTAAKHPRGQRGKFRRK